MTKEIHEREEKEIRKGHQLSDYDTYFKFKQPVQGIVEDEKEQQDRNENDEIIQEVLRELLTK